MSVTIADLIPVLTDIAEQCPFPYHNLCHTRDVIARTRNLIPCIKPTLSEREADLLVYAAAYHDYGHCGQTVRQRCTRDIPCKDLSNEEYAARIAVNQLQHVFEPNEIGQLKNMILATSFGQSDPSFEFYRPYMPLTLSEKMLAFADIAGYLHGFEEWVEENFFVLLEADARTLPPNFEAWQEGRRKFVGYIKTKLDDLQPYLTPGFFLILSTQLRGILAQLDTHLERHRSVFEKIRASRLAAFSDST